MDPLLTVRAALVFLVTAVVTIVAFVLAYVASTPRNPATAALVAGAAAGGTLLTINQLIGG